MAKMQLEVAKKELMATRPTFEQMNLNKLDFNKEMEFAIQAFQANDYLLTCDPTTIRNSLVNIVMTGLTLNPVMKFCYLVPRNGKCCVDPSYMGLIKIITDTGSVKSIRAGVVYAKELFDIELGSDGYVKHKPFMGEGTKGKRLGAYSVAVLNDGSYHVEFMYEAELMAIKARSEMGKKDTGSWKTDEAEMCRKTVVKRHWKYLPKSERALMAAQAIDLDNELNGIDFKAEQNQKQQGRPTMEEGVALCTAEDIDRIMELLDDQAMPEVIMVSAERPNGFKKSAMKSAFQKQYDAGTMEKDKAESNIKGLEEELAKHKQAPDVDLSDDATDTDAKAEAQPEEVEIKTSAIQPNESFEDFK